MFPTQRTSGARGVRPQYSGADSPLSTDCPSPESMQALLVTSRAAAKAQATCSASCWVRAASTVADASQGPERSAFALGLKPRNSGLPQPQLDVKTAIAKCKEASRRNFDEVRWLL
jgi:hypothetical protein